MDYEFIAERLVKLANVSDLQLAAILKANIISELVAAVNYGRERGGQSAHKEPNIKKR